MLGTLVKKQLTEIFRSYFYDSRRNKARSKAVSILLILLFGLLMVVFIGGMFYMIASGLCEPMCAMGLDWLYFALMGLMGVLLGVFGSVFTTYSGLYLAKDNDLLLSMPLPVSVIVASRLVGVYLMSFMFSAVVTGPAAVVYWMNGYNSAAKIIGGLLFIFIISALVLALACVLGYGVARLSMRLKNKSFLVTAFSLIFIAAYYYLYFMAQEKLQDFISHLDQYAEGIQNSLRGLKIFGEV